MVVRGSGGGMGGVCRDMGLRILDMSFVAMLLMTQATAYA